MLYPPSLPYLLLLLGCAPPPRPVDPRPSVLLITLDTTRADHLGCYGDPLAETPTWDALAASGTLFLRATSSAPLTIPSHSTILTGRFPPSHGVRDNGDYVLPDEAVTLAERFHAAGYATAAFTSAFPTHRRWGFAQGFDVYQDPLPRDVSVQDWRDQRSADEVIDDVLQQLPHLDGPVFMWVHLFDAHWPYEAPPDFALRHAGRPYDAEIAFADAQGARLLAAFGAAFPNHVVAVTADHGEGLGDGGEETHGFLLHDGTLHVPLILAGTGVPIGVDEDPVSHVDMAPTLLRLTGLPLDDRLQGRDLFSGGSAAIYSEALTGQFQLGLAPLRARTDEAGRTTVGGRARFYPYTAGEVITREDPSAPVDALAAELETFAASLEVATAPEAALDASDMEMLTRLGYLGTGDVHAPAGVVDPQDVIELIPLTWAARQAMGAGRTDVARGMLDELKTGMGGAFGVRQLDADILRAEGRVEEALEAYVALWHESPSSGLAQQIGDTYLDLGDPREAASWYEAALDRLAVAPRAMAGLVEAALAMDEPERAEELAQRFLVTFPDQAELHLVLAQTLLAAHRPREALAEAEVAVQRTPNAKQALELSARAMWELGDSNRAIDRLQHSLMLDPYDIPTRLRLTEWLLDVGRNAESVRTVMPIARLFPADPEIGAVAARAQTALARERRGG